MGGMVIRNLIWNELFSWTLVFLFLCNSRNSSAPIGRQLLSKTATVVVPLFYTYVKRNHVRDFPRNFAGIMDIQGSRLFTVLYFSVRSTRSSALRYGLLKTPTPAPSVHLEIKMTVIDGKTRYIQTISRKNRGLWTVYPGSRWIDRQRISEVVIWVPPNLWGFEHSIPAFQLNYRLKLNFNGGSLN